MHFRQPTRALTVILGSAVVTLTLLSGIAAAGAITSLDLRVWDYPGGTPVSGIVLDAVVYGDPEEPSLGLVHTGPSGWLTVVFPDDFVEPGEWIIATFDDGSSEQDVGFRYGNVGDSDPEWVLDDPPGLVGLSSCPNSYNAMGGYFEIYMTCLSSPGFSVAPSAVEDSWGTLKADFRE